MANMLIYNFVWRLMWYAKRDHGNKHWLELCMVYMTPMSLLKPGAI